MIKLVDLNRSLIQEAKKAGIDATWGDYFSDIQPNEILITASNPKWTFGGGIDAVFMENYRGWCKIKQDKGGGMERIGQICFAITVDENLRATEEIITKALEFGLSQLKKGEVLRTSALGCGIGGLPPFTFIEILKKLSPTPKVK